MIKFSVDASSYSDASYSYMKKICSRAMLCTIVAVAAVVNASTMSTPLLYCY
jgi:hypothetical protein